MKNYRCHTSKHSFCYPVDNDQKPLKTLRDCLVECRGENQTELKKIDAPEYRIRRAYEDLVSDILHPRCLKERDNLLLMQKNVRAAQAILYFESTSETNMKRLEELTSALLNQCDVAFLIWFLTKPYHSHQDKHLENRLGVLSNLTKHRAVEYKAFIVNMFSRFSACYSNRCSQLIKADMFQRARSNLRNIEGNSEFVRYLLDIFHRFL